MMMAENESESESAIVRFNQVDTREISDDTVITLQEPIHQPIAYTSHSARTWRVLGIYVVLAMYIITALVLSIWGLVSIIDQYNNDNVSLTLTQHIFCIIYVVTSTYDVANGIVMWRSVLKKNYPRIAMYIFAFRVVSLFIFVLCDPGHAGYPIFMAHVYYNYSVVIWFILFSKLKATPEINLVMHS